MGLCSSDTQKNGCPETGQPFVGKGRNVCCSGDCRRFLLLDCFLCCAAVRLDYLLVNHVAKAKVYQQNENGGEWVFGAFRRISVVLHKHQFW